MEATQVSISKLMDKQNVVYTYNRMLFTLHKGRNSDLYYNIDEPWGYYTNWDKLVTQGQILYGSTYISVVKIMEIESVMVFFPGLVEVRNGKLLFNGLWSFSFTRRKGIWRCYGGDSYTMLWIYSGPLNCTSKNG